AGPEAFTAYTWDGRMDNLFDADWNGTDWRVPDGEYILEVSAVSALGQTENPDHVQTVYSAPVTIDRDGDGKPWWETLPEMFGVTLPMRDDELCNLSRTRHSSYRARKCIRTRYES